MVFQIENFEEVRIKGEFEYKQIGSVYCPFLKEKISFTAEGLEHLKFKRRAIARPRQDQYMRLRLIKIAPKVLELSATVQGIWNTKGFERVRKHSRTEMVLLPVIFWEFIAVIEGIRVKIIVKQVDSGPKMFWSIIPHWGIDKNTKERKMYNGNLHEI